MEIENLKEATIIPNSQAYVHNICFSFFVIPCMMHVCLYILTGYNSKIYVASF